MTLPVFYSLVVILHLLTFVFPELNRWIPCAKQQSTDMADVLLSASLQVLFDRLASPELVNFIRRKNLSHDLLNELKRKSVVVHKVLNDAEMKQILTSLTHFAIFGGCEDVELFPKSACCPLLSLFLQSMVFQISSLLTARGFNNSPLLKSCISTAAVSSNTWQERDCRTPSLVWLWTHVLYWNNSANLRKGQNGVIYLTVQI